MREVSDNCIHVADIHIYLYIKRARLGEERRETSDIGRRRRETSKGEQTVESCELYLYIRHIIVYVYA